MTEAEEPLYNVLSVSPKIYQPNMVRVASFLGGPLVAGYMIAENFKAFNQYGKAKRTWLFTLLFTLALFGLTFSIPETSGFPKLIVPLVYAWAAFALTNQYQGRLINAHVTNGGESFGWGRSIVVGLIGMVVFIVLIMASAIILDMFLPNA